MGAFIQEAVPSIEEAPVKILQNERGKKLRLARFVFSVD